MKRHTLTLPLLLFVLAFALSSCYSTRKINADRDGLSYETAIVVKSIQQEYDWIKENYPESMFIRQALNEHDRKYYDVFTLEIVEGERIKVYFDISRFFEMGF